MAFLSPKDSGKFISDNSSLVNIKTDGIEKLSKRIIDEINSGHLRASNFGQSDVHPKADDPKAVDWLFVVDTLNFCFWHHENEEGWNVQGYTGYYALCAAINRAIKENIDILNPTFYSTITEDTLKKILRSDTKIEIPLLNERLKCLHETGNILLEKFDGTFENVVKQAGNSAKKLLALIVNNFKCFKDDGVFKEQNVSFYKRAQILIGDIWACFDGKTIGHFNDLNEITMFADYRVPQTLLWYGVFQYEPELLDKLNTNTIFENGSAEEQEIRGCSIHAVELIKDYVNKHFKKEAINSILIDHFLWDFRRKHADEIRKKELPFHKVLCIYY